MEYLNHIPETETELRKTILNEIENPKARWDWMISLCTMPQGETFNRQRKFEIIKTKSILIKMNSTFYWAELVMEKEPWKFDYSYFKKYPKKADLIIFTLENDRYLMHSLNKKITMHTGNYRYHMILHEKQWEEFDLNIFDFELEKMDYVNKHVTLQICKESNISLMIKQGVINFLKTKFKHSDIFVFMTDQDYLFFFNEKSKNLDYENALFFRVLPNQILKMSIEKPFSEILDWLKEAFMVNTKYTVSSKHESDAEDDSS